MVATNCPLLIVEFSTSAQFTTNTTPVFSTSTQYQYSVFFSVSVSVLVAPSIQYQYSTVQYVLFSSGKLGVDGESNGNLQPNESKCANMAGSGNRHTVCRQRAYLFTIDTDCSAPHALAEHCKATIAKRRDPICSQTLSLTHPTHPCAATHAPCMLPLQRCHVTATNSTANVSIHKF